MVSPTSRDSFQDNKWCLEEDVLRDHVLDTLDLEGREGQNLLFRSSYSSDVYYEVFVREFRNEDRVGINIWYTGGGNRRYNCVYWRGRIVRWGVWVVELMDTLPHLISKTGIAIAEREAVKVVRENHGAMPNGSFPAAEHVLAEDMGMDENSAESFRSWNRSGVPVRHL